VPSGISAVNFTQGFFLASHRSQHHQAHSERNCLGLTADERQSTYNCPTTTIKWRWGSNLPPPCQPQIPPGRASRDDLLP
jgi:hypothetical protein